MIFIVYQTTNLINNKIYIGVHQTENVDDGYLGSGTVFEKAVVKYGRENFSRKILFEGMNREEILSKERKIVNRAFVNRNDTYNIALGGIGYKSEVNPFKNKTHSIEARRKIGNTGWTGQRRHKISMARRERSSVITFWMTLDNQFKSFENYYECWEWLKKNIKEFARIPKSQQNDVNEFYLYTIRGKSKIWCWDEKHPKHNTIKMRCAKIGNRRNKGNEHTDETKKKISLAQKGVAKSLKVRFALRDTLPKIRTFWIDVNNNIHIFESHYECWDWVKLQPLEVSRISKTSRQCANQFYRYTVNGKRKTWCYCELIDSN